MIKNYFLSALRSMKRSLSFTLLNILGLSLGIASCLIIFLIVKNELGFDSAGKKATRTYRVTLNAIDFNANVSMAIIPAMRNDFPELEQSTQVYFERDGMVQIGQRRLKEINYAFADEQFPKTFDLHWISGNPQTALSDPNSAVLTETTAQKYFGNQDAMGQIFRLNNEYTLKVTGIIQDPPGNNSLPFT